MKASSVSILISLTLASAQAARADLLQGRLIDRFGVGIAGANIDAIDDQGNQVLLANDGTAGDGTFSVTIDPGTYTIIFNPPPPPASTYVAVALKNVVVSGVKNLGDVSMADGVFVSGRVTTLGGTPVENVDIDILDGQGAPTFLKGDKTDFDGNYTVTAPKGKIELRLDPANASIQVLAPLNFNKLAFQDKFLGTVALPPGFTVTGVIRDSGLNAVVGADLDTKDTLTGRKLYTPGDNTDNNGFVDFIVPAGIYDIEVGPQLSDRLVTKRILALPINSDTTLGIVTLEAGVLLSGQVRSAGVGIFGFDLDLRDSATQLSVPTTDDNTDASGNYAVIVPTGTLDLIYTPMYSIPYSSVVIPNETITSDLVRDVFPADCECFTVSGTGVRGTGGLLPRLVASGGYLRTGNPGLRLRIRNARGGALGMILVGVQTDLGGSTFGGPRQSVGGIGRLIVPVLPFQLSGATGVAGEGAGKLEFALPNDPAIAGLTIISQGFVRDPQAAGGTAMTRPLIGVACD